ncbi:MAG: hypothetical protein QOI41_2775, partial [Myxococcales bacterium]|nr:hypothetical protein [Myxococcales bacterium]
MAQRSRRTSSGASPPLLAEGQGARANDNDLADAERSLESIEERLDREAASSDLLDVPAAV